MHRNNHIKNLSDNSQQCLFKNIFGVNKNRFFLVKKLYIQVNVFMIMLTCSSERIFNSMHYTGYIIHYSHYPTLNACDYLGVFPSVSFDNSDETLIKCF